MPTLVNRGIAILLTACLLVDPALASAASNPLIPVGPSFIFTSQALAPEPESIPQPGYKTFVTIAVVGLAVAALMASQHHWIRASLLISTLVAGAFAGGGHNGAGPPEKDPKSLLFWRLAFKVLVRTSRVESRGRPPVGRVADAFRADQPDTAFFVAVDKRTYFIRESVANAWDGVMGRHKNWSGQFVDGTEPASSLAEYVLFLDNLRKIDRNAYVLIGPLGMDGFRILRHVSNTPGNILVRLRSGETDESYIMTMAHQRSREYLRREISAADRDLLIRAFKAILKTPEIGPPIEGMFLNMEAYREGIPSGKDWEVFWTWMIWPGDHDPAAVQAIHGIAEVAISGIERGDAAKGRRIREVLRRTQNESEKWARATFAKAKQVDPEDFQTGVVPDTDFDLVNRQRGYRQDAQGRWHDEQGHLIQDDSSRTKSSENRLIEFDPYLLGLLASGGRLVQKVGDVGLGIDEKTGHGAPTFYELADVVHRAAPGATLVGLDTQANVLAAAEKAKGNRKNIVLVPMPTKDFVIPAKARDSDLLRVANVIRNYGLPGDQERAIVNLIQGVREGGWLVVIESEGPGEEGYFYTFQRRDGKAVPVAFGFALRNLEYEVAAPFGTPLGGIDFSGLRQELPAEFYSHSVIPMSPEVLMRKRDQVISILREHGFAHVRQLHGSYVIIEFPQNPTGPVADKDSTSNRFGPGMLWFYADGARGKMPAETRRWWALKLAPETALVLAIIRWISPSAPVTAILLLAILWALHIPLISATFKPNRLLWRDWGMLMAIPLILYGFFGFLAAQADGSTWFILAAAAALQYLLDGIILRGEFHSLFDGVLRSRRLATARERSSRQIKSAA